MNRKIQPKFNPEVLKNQESESAEKLKNEVRNLTAKAKPSPHSKIFAQLLEQISPVSFYEMAFPELKQLRLQLSTLNPEDEDYKKIKKLIDSKQLKKNDLIVLVVEYVLLVAAKLRLGLCKFNDFLYMYNGAFWEVIEENALMKFLGEAAEKMGIYKLNARFFRFRENLVKQFNAAAYKTMPEPDYKKVLINLQNGTFEITPEATKLRPFKQEDFLKYQLPFAYDPSSKAPIFQKYLDRVLPEKEKQLVISEYLGYVLLRNAGKRLKIEKVLMLHGPGANGKSVLFEVVIALLGTENVSSYSLQNLTTNPIFRASLANVLVNYTSEINGKLESATFKQMVSGEPIEARLLYNNPYVLRDYAKLIFNVNELPRDVEHTAAFFRRFLIVPFDVTIPPEEQDKDLHTRITENELPGVFNWVLDGLKRLLKQEGFTHCQAIDDAIENYKIESNSVRLFLREKGYERSSNDYTRLKELYVEYKEFCSDDRMIPFGKRKFSGQLKALGFHFDREGGTNQNIIFLAQDEKAKKVTL